MSTGVNKSQQRATYVSLACFSTSLLLSTIAFCSQHWVHAEIISTSELKLSGYVQTGVFSGIRSFITNNSEKREPFKVVNEIQQEHSFFSRLVWLFIIFFETMALIWMLIGVFTCLISIKAQLYQEASLIGSNGIYLWCLLSSMSHGCTLALFYSQFHSSLQSTMLLPDQLAAGFTTSHHISLSYSFYMSLLALCILYVPAVTVVVFTERIWPINKKDTTTFDPTIMLY